MARCFKILLLIAIVVAGCRNYHYKRLILKERVGNDTLIIKEVGGEVLTGGILAFKKTKDSLHKISIINDVYTEAKVVGFNSHADSLLIEFNFIQNDKLMRTDTLGLPWHTYIESQKLKNNLKIHP